MADISLRQTAQNCLGVSGSISVTDHVYGYVFRDSDGSVFGALSSGDTLPGSGEQTTRSLKRHLRTISGQALDLVIILVGHQPDFSGAFSRSQVAKAQYAIQVTRDLYAQVDVGVRRIIWSWISPADAGGYININSPGEAEDLTDDWSGPNGGVDLFLVQSIDNAAGWSSGDDGPCDKTSKFGFSGAVLEISGSPRFTGIALGHEVGHFLGLGHADTIENMMGVDADGDGTGAINSNSTNITGSQGVTMRTHCSVTEEC